MIQKKERRSWHEEALPAKQRNELHENVNAQMQSACHPTGQNGNAQRKTCLLRIRTDRICRFARSSTMAQPRCPRMDRWREQIFRSRISKWESQTANSHGNQQDPL